MTPDAAPRNRVLLTGCTGFVGKVVLEELLRRRTELGIERIYVLIRGRGSKTPAERFEQKVAVSPCFSLLEPEWQQWCETVGGDITSEGLAIPAPESARLAAELTHIVNCAASVEFDLPIMDAARINVTGALNMLAFARRCGSLQRMVHVSTAYVTPHPGQGVPIDERLVDLPFNAEEVYSSIVAGRADEKELLAETRHANTYTFTKCMAEVLLARRRGDTPLTVLRPSIVSACRRSPFPGWIDSRAAYAGFVSLLGAGYLKVVRADPTARIDVVPCDDVADRIISCAFDPAHAGPFVVRHAVAGMENCATIAKAAKAHEDYFRAHPHEKEARWEYLGTSETSFRFHEWVHHHLPVGTARVVTRMNGRRRAARKVDRLADVLAYLNKAFHYFVSRTFNFQTVFPPLEDFDLDSYLDSVSHGISQYLLRRNPTEAPLRMHGTDFGWAFRQPEGNFTVRVLAYLVRKALRRAGAEITFNEAEIKSALREVRDGDLVVLAPSHRSYIDFLVTSLVCFAHPGLGLRMPRVAATDDFSRIPIVGPVLRRGGAFYIRRGLGKADPELTRQISELVDAGHSLEFYPEGTRSRTGRFLMPKRGILRALQATGRPAVALPLAISYERLAEENGFLRELDGRGKHKGGLKALAAWTGKLLQGKVRLGRIHIRCGVPLRLDGSTEVVPMSRELIAELQRHATVTTHHLRAFCRRHADLGIDPMELRKSIVRRGGAVMDSKLPRQLEMHPLLERTFEAQWMHLFYADALQRASANAAVVAHIRRNGFWFPKEPAELGDRLSEAVVTALFEPICRDYARVARAVEGMRSDAEFTASDLVRRMPGAFLADVEDALDDLCERGVLTSDKGRYRWATPSLDLAEYRNDCAWQGLHGAAA
jgi:alcohol-forming fatty acyl-CoA reductase